jgi:GDP-L-fucose synthase
MKILITGGNGYVAKSLYESFKKKYNITTTTRQNFDLTSYDETCEWFEEREFDVVIHTAISGGSRLHEDKHSVFENNMAMFNNLVTNKHCFSKLISFGSGAELFHGNTPYADSKREIAKQILEYSNFYNLRIFGVFDHNELNTRFIKSNIIRYIKKKPMLIHTNKIMDFFYMEDLINLVDHYIQNDNLVKTINCSYETKSTLVNIAKFINTLSNYEVSININNKNCLEFYCGDSDLPIKTTGLEQGILNTYKIFKNNSCII